MTFIFFGRSHLNLLLLPCKRYVHQGLNVTAVERFGSVDTTRPPAVQIPRADLTEMQSVGAHSKEMSTYAPPVRQGPGGNSSLVLG